MSRPRRLAYLALFVNALIWGVAFPIIKPALDYITPMQYLYFRFLVAGVFSLPIFLVYWIKSRPKLSYSIKVLLIELFGMAFPLWMLYEGLSRTSALEASLIGSTGPIFVVLGGIIFLHERENRREWQGLALSLLGSLILVAEPLLTGSHLDTPTSTGGNLYIMGYNIIYTMYVIIAKKQYRTHPPVFYGSLTYLGTACIYALILMHKHALLPISALFTTPHVLFPVVYMAIPGSILAFGLYLYAQSKIEVSEANLFTYLNGVIAIPAAFFLLGEVPSLITIIATLIIASGVIRAEMSGVKRTKRAA